MRARIPRPGRPTRPRATGRLRTTTVAYIPTTHPPTSRRARTEVMDGIHVLRDEPPARLVVIIITAGFDQREIVIENIGDPVNFKIMIEQLSEKLDRPREMEPKVEEATDQKPE